MKKILHKIAHLLNWNYGVCDSFYENERLMMSFLCSGCGKRSGIHCIDKIIDRELHKSFAKDSYILARAMLAESKKEENN